MRSFVIAASLVALASAGCGSSSSASTGGPTTPTTAATASPPVSAGREPLAALDASTAKAEKYTIEGEGETSLLYFEAANLTLSASCKKPDGKLDCAAYRAVRDEAPTPIPHRQLDGRVSAGTLVCRRLGHTSVTATNSVGAQDGFCKFPDGSLVDVGALERYGMKVIE